MAKRVCVVGSGASGLTTIKQLKDVGITNIDCFEKDSDVGGVFHYGEAKKNGLYDNVVLTISDQLMCFSDMPPLGHRYHWHHRQYWQYLADYAAKFDLLKHIEFKTRVTCVEGKPGKWHVVVQTEGKEPKDMGFYDKVVVCSGTHHVSKVPTFAGQDTFTGQIVHSVEYKNNKKFAGKECVCVGLGESGADIVREISDVSKSCTLSLRSWPALLPRIPFGMAYNPWRTSSDAFSSRFWHEVIGFVCDHKMGGCRHLVNRAITTWAACAYAVFPCLGRDSDMGTKDAFNQDIKGNYMDNDTKMTPACYALVEEWYNKSGCGSNRIKFLTKNATFVPNVVNGKIQVNVEGVDRIDGDYVIFKDGARARAEYIVLCTGFSDKFPFLKGNIGDTNIPLDLPTYDNSVRALFKHIFHPDIGDSMAWVGFARPHSGGVPAASEMSARYVAQIFSGNKKLPKNWQDIAKQECAQDNKDFALTADIKSLISYCSWSDSVASLIGCQVSYWRYLFQPKLLIRLCLGQLMPQQYRLRGPGAMPKEAKEAILEQPVPRYAYQYLKYAPVTWLRTLNPRCWFIKY